MAESIKAAFEEGLMSSHDVALAGIAIACGATMISQRERLRFLGGEKLSWNDREAVFVHVHGHHYGDWFGRLCAGFRAELYFLDCF